MEDLKRQAQASNDVKEGISSEDAGLTLGDSVSEDTASSERPQGKLNKWSEEFWKQAFQNKAQGDPGRGEEGVGPVSCVPALPERQPDGSSGSLPGPPELNSAPVQVPRSPVKERRVQEQLGSKRSPLQATRDFWENIARGKLITPLGSPPIARASQPLVT